MGAGAFGDRGTLARLVLAAAARRTWRFAARLATSPGRVAARAPEKLLIAPQDLRTSDPVRAAEIYGGAFTFTGRTISVAGRSPFLAPAPSREWAVALHGFGWLRHLRAADTALARTHARALVEEWLALRGGPDPSARDPSVTARRLISWLCHSPLILDGADRAFYRRFLRGVARQTRSVSARFEDAPDGAPRLSAAIALAYAGLCLSGEQRLLAWASTALSAELDRQILADGGTLDRNPATLVEALLDLLPLRQAYAARDDQPPRALVNAIDRMMPMLRFLRHGDGNFAQFNGAGPIEGDFAATLLSYDDVRGSGFEDAPHAGYQRLTGGEALVIVDAGPPPPPALSAHAHAGCLSFEFSSGMQRLVVNCGAPRSGRRDWEKAARVTAAHSTLTIGDQSSARFAPDAVRSLLGPLIMGGPASVPVRREPHEDGMTLVTSHDGYAARFGVTHERILTLSLDGRRLAGEDRLLDVAPASTDGDPRVALRFHLHPSVRASMRQDGQGALLAPQGGAGWTFSAPGFPVAVEESVHLAGPHGPRRTEQIVVYATLAGARSIAWSFESLEPEPASRQRRLPPAANLFGAPPDGG